MDKALLPLTLAFALPALAAAQAPTPPLRIVGKAQAVTFQENGQTRTYYKLVPGKPLELATAGEMTLLLPARAIGGGARAPSISVLVTSPGATPKAQKETLSVVGGQVALSDGAKAFAPRVVRVPIPFATATVRLSVDFAPGAIVGFARVPLEGATAAAATPTPAPAATPSVAAASPLGDPAAPDPSLGAGPGGDPTMGMPIMPLPLIRRRVERLGIGPRVAYMIPAGAVDPGSSNVYAGAELRVTVPAFERSLAFTAEGGTYTLTDTEPLNATSPFGVATENEVTVSTRVVPLLGGAIWRVKLGSNDRQAVFAGANGGIVLATRTEEIEFRGATSESETRYGAQARLGVEKKIGPGRTVLEASYLHVTPSEDEQNDTYLGGAFLGLQYRFVF